MKSAAINPDIQFQPYQQKLIDEAKEKGPLHKLLFFGLGSGKTGTGLGIAEAANKPYLVVGPASLRPNLQQEIKKFTTGETPSKVISYNEALKGKSLPAYHSLIIDELHNLRSSESARSQKVEELANKAQQVVMMSGSPIINGPSDLSFPLSLLTKQHVSPKEFTQRYLKKETVNPNIFQRLIGVTPGQQIVPDNVEELKSLLRGKVDYYQPEQSLVPVTHHDIEVEASPEQATIYKAMWGQLPRILKWKMRWNYPLSDDELKRALSFLQGPRQVLNSTFKYMKNPDPWRAYGTSPKLQKIFEIVNNKLEEPQGKALVFSNYVQSSLIPLKAAFDKAKIPAEIFHGTLNDRERSALVDRYNRGDIKVGLIAPSGSEGLNFKGTRAVVLGEPHYHSQRHKQSIGRAIRLGSHDFLPEELKNVEVYRMIGKLPLGFTDKIMSGLGFDREEQRRSVDDILLGMSAKKEHLNQKFLDILKEVGSEGRKQASDITLYRGIQSPQEHPDPELYKQLVLKAITTGLDRRESRQLQDIGRRRRAFYTPEKELAQRYMGPRGSLLSLSLPQEDLPQLQVEYNNLGKPNQSLVVQATIDQIKKNIEAGRWKQASFDTRQSIGSHIHSHTLPTGEEVKLDVYKLIELLKNRQPTQVPISELDPKQFQRSRQSGFRKKHYEEADVNYPIILDETKRLIDGRHSLFKLLDSGATHAPAHILATGDSDVAKVAAVGIPDRKDFGDLSKLEVGKLLDLIIQNHKVRSGIHRDIRIGDPEMGLHSWAMRHELPKPGEKRLLIHQPLHAHSYGSFEGEIPEGYGKGTVKKELQDRVLITKSNPSEIHFTTATSRYPERFALIKTNYGKDGKSWLLINTTRQEPIPHEKKHYKLIEPEEVEPILKNLEPGSSVQSKIDGSAGLYKLLNKHIEIASYRTAQPPPGKHEHKKDFPIIHSERVWGNRPEFDIPKQYQGSVLRGELYGVKDNKAIPPQELGGLLNAGIERSLNTQKERGIQLKNLLFDIEQFGKQRITHETPYSERLDKLKEIMKILPSDKFHLPEEAKTPDEAMRMWKDITEGRNPLSQEGIVGHPNTGMPWKAKIRPEYDVHIRDIFEGLGKYKGQGAGGFHYSTEPTGPIVGKVGTGLSDELRKEMWKDPQAFLGRVAKITAQGRFPKSQAFRAPSLLSLHEDITPTAQTKEGSNMDPGVSQIINDIQITFKEAEEKAPTIYLVRHGKTKMNSTNPAEDRIRGWANVPLNTEGWKEAKRLTKFFKSIPLDIIHSSDLNRAEDTAYEISTNHPRLRNKVVHMKTLRPWNLGKYQGELSSKVHPIIEDLARKQPNKQIENGESFNDFATRWLKELKEMMDYALTSKKTVLAVVHFRNVKLAEAWLAKDTPPEKEGKYDIDIETFMKNDLPTGTIVKLMYKSNKWTFNKIEKATKDESKQNSNDDRPTT